jgi:phage gpG-like protein
MKLSIEFTEQSLEFIKNFPELSLKAIDDGFGKALLVVEGVSKKDFTGHLHVRSGQLRRSIYSQKTGFLKGFAGSDLKYAAIHQYGGIIRPVRAMALRFKIGGKFVTAKKVTMPARPYIVPEIDRIEMVMAKHFDMVMQNATK